VSQLQKSVHEKSHHAEQGDAMKEKKSMKILVGSFQCESNTFSDAKAGKESFYILHGEEAKNKLFASHLFEEKGYEVVPLVYAVSLPSGMVMRECFDEVLADFKAEAAKHPDADGSCL
jgi:microcystin degradation protein MlrC